MKTTRRELLAGAAAGIFCPALLKNAFAADATRICSVLSLSGPFSSAGKPADLGARLAVRALASKYGLSAEYVALDDEGNPGRAMPKIITAAQREKIRFFSGPVLSSVGLAMSQAVANLGGVYVSSIGADEVTGSECRKSTFRWPVPSYGAIQQTVRPLIGMLPSARRWFTVTPSYVFGEALLRNSKAIFKELGVEHVGNIDHSLTETEFSGHITNILAAKPDVILVLNFGPQTTNFLRQAAEFGLKDKMKILVAWGAGLEQFSEIGSDVLDGVYFGLQYWHDVDTPKNKAIVELFRNEANTLPSWSMVNLFTCNDLLLQGLKKAKSDDPQEVIKALEGLTYEGPTGEENIRPFDHQCVKEYYLALAKPASKKKNDADFVDIVSSGRSFVEQAISQCRMT
ncbi:ABC transporter substrate-binding protein [Bradyrhizobium sp. 149]|uniref:ABC transporter substrate-binding protein n=1 Tax=Bradyrhizobium sp. 149 TaxID=2782624 RepID=UPI001FF920CA|nr:ABC transporter substrate-binding protein [Bradyrhizobium sp. 149]MCK1655336.1 ABC transporter substrate-binding protein [Bradyrhizobium sp. 149]